MVTSLYIDCSSEHGKRQKAAEDIFGTNPLPKLEKFTFKVRMYMYIMRQYKVIRCFFQKNLQGGDKSGTIQFKGGGGGGQKTSHHSMLHFEGGWTSFKGAHPPLKETTCIIYIYPGDIPKSVTYWYLYMHSVQIEAPLTGTDEVICCSVKLTGTSVLRGVKQCIISDTVSLPVPSILTALHSSGSNSVLVQHDSTDKYLRQARSAEDKENEPINKT